MFFKVLFVTVAIFSLANGGLLRTPRVYNALVTSNENLAPSRSFPVIQPVLQETAYGYPLHPLPPYSFGQYGPYGHHNGPYGQHFGPGQHYGPFLSPELDTIPPIPELPQKQEDPKEKDSKKSASNESEKTAEEPSKESPLIDPLSKDENLKRYLQSDEYRFSQGLPPLSPYNFDQSFPTSYSNAPHQGIYDPYSFNPYSPYPVHYPNSPYPVLAPEFYNFPNAQQPLPPPSKDAPEIASKVDVTTEDSKESNPKTEEKVMPPMAPASGDIKNNEKKNPEIPDVPPPPPPNGADKIMAS